MSDLRRGTFTRGASVLAALVIIAVLGGAFTVLDYVSPETSISTNTQGEEDTQVQARPVVELSQEINPVAQMASVSVAPITQVAAADEAVVEDVAARFRQTVTRLPSLDGFDNFLLLYYVGGKPTPLQGYIGVCPTADSLRKANEAVGPRLTEPYSQPQWLVNWASRIRTQYPVQPNEFALVPGTRCAPDSARVQRPKPGTPWERWTFMCEQETPTGTVSFEAPDTSVRTVSFVEEEDTIELARAVRGGGIKCQFFKGNGTGATVPTPVATTAAARDLARRLAAAPDQTERDRILAEARASGINQDVLRSALSEHQTEVTAELTERRRTLDATVTEIRRLADDGVTPEACASVRTSAPMTEAAAILAASAADCARLQALTADQQRLRREIEERNLRLSNLAVALRPEDRREIPPDSRTYTPPPSNPNSNTFGNNTPGNQCQQGYVCQGNTLYFRAPQIMGSMMQCMTQPVQQCQYGCAQPFSAFGAAQGQNQGGIGSIMQYIPLVTSLMGMFTGQNNGMNGMSAMMQSTQCSPTPQQQPNPYGNGTNGQPCSQPQPQQPPPSSCSTGSWQPQAAQGNGCVTGWQCVPNSTTPAGAPKANLSCQPKTGDIGMNVSISYACDNSTDTSADGFSVNGHVGTSSATIQAPAAGTNSVTYTLTCKNAQNQTSSAQCKVDIVKPLIVLVANPRVVKSGEATSLGWITSGMLSCKISNADFKDWTAQQANNTNVNGAVQSPPITKNTLFVLDCNSAGGQTKEATVQVNVQ